MLLIGLFFYDIFWVFFTPVMVDVATKINGPIKLLFPRTGALPGDPKPHALLGLGDIVLPGIFLALLLRFDLRRAGGDPARLWPKYFAAGMAGYTAGIVATVAIMTWFRAAQPALLYLVPGVLLPPLATAFFSGELKDLWAFADGEPTEAGKASGAGAGAAGSAEVKKDR